MPLTKIIKDHWDLITNIIILIGIFLICRLSFSPYAISKTRAICHSSLQHTDNTNLTQKKLCSADKRKKITAF